MSLPIKMDFSKEVSISSLYFQVTEGSMPTKELHADSSFKNAVNCLLFMEFQLRNTGGGAVSKMFPGKPFQQEVAKHCPVKQF